ncbi:MAG: hypothetical protein J5934_03015 [Succinivibrio sp.]|nr:hypothetical protein [Succinivibrio sp.]
MDATILTRVDSTLKQLALEKAQQSGKSLSEVIRDFLTDYVSVKTKRSAAGMCDQWATPMPGSEFRNFFEESVEEKFKNG